MDMGSEGGVRELRDFRNGSDFRKRFIRRDALFLWRPYGPSPMFECDFSQIETSAFSICSRANRLFREPKNWLGVPDVFIADGGYGLASPFAWPDGFKIEAVLDLRPSPWLARIRSVGTSLPRLA